MPNKNRLASATGVSLFLKFGFFNNVIVEKLGFYI